MSTPILELDQVSFGHDGAEPLISDLTLDFEAGGCSLLRGPSGGGKTTLLRLFNRLEEPQSGHIRFEGRDLPEWTPSALRARLLMVPQTPVALPGSVGQNLEWAFDLAANRQRPRPTTEAQEKMLARFSLAAVALDSPAGNLSVGQLQRLGLARALLLEPPVLLLDEPTSALDQDSAFRVRDVLVTEMRERQLTVVIVSHRPELNGLPRARRLTLENGQLREDA